MLTPLQYCSHVHNTRQQSPYKTYEDYYWVMFCGVFLRDTAFYPWIATVTQGLIASIEGVAHITLKLKSSELVAGPVQALLSALH